jgi:hypothetical protein
MSASSSAEGASGGATLAAWRGLHSGDAIADLGSGASALMARDLRGVITIDVKDIGRLFTPTYPVVVNPPGQFRSDGFQYVRVSQAKTLFTQLDLGRAARGALPARAVRRHRQQQRRRRRPAPHPELPLRGCLPGRVHGCCAHRPHPPSA